MKNFRNPTIKNKDAQSFALGVRFLVYKSAISPLKIRIYCL